jgi:hydroxyethylthiazole kinase-like sugar kinase family protein
MKLVNGIWQDALNILETASAVQDGNSSEIAILIDDRNGMRIVDACGWQLDALRREYSAKTAYTVKRTTGSVVVEAQSGADHCLLTKTIASNPLASMARGIPYHLIRSKQAMLA